MEITKEQLFDLWQDFIKSNSSVSKETISPGAYSEISLTAGGYSISIVNLDKRDQGWIEITKFKMVLSRKKISPSEYEELRKKATSNLPFSIESLKEFLQK